MLLSSIRETITHIILERLTLWLVDTSVGEGPQDLQLWSGLEKDDAHHTSTIQRELPETSEERKKVRHEKTRAIPVVLTSKAAAV